MQGAVIQESRDSLRNAALSLRIKLAQTDCLSWSRSIQDSAIAMPQFRTAQSVALYSSIQNEVATETILGEALASGKRVYFPKLSGDGPVGFAQIHNGSGSPNNVVTATQGSLYLNTAGGAGSTLWVWVKESEWHHLKGQIRQYERERIEFREKLDKIIGQFANMDLAD